MSLRIQPRAYGPTACVRYRVLVLPFILPLHSHPLVAAPKQRDFFVFAFSTINTLRVLHRSLTQQQTDKTSSKGKTFKRKKKKKKKRKKEKKIREIFFLDDGFDDDDDDDVVVVPGDFDARKENTPSCAHGLAHRDSGIFFHDRTRAR